MNFKWYDVRVVLPEDVMEHLDIVGGEIVPKKTADVLVRYKTKSGKIRVVMGHRGYSMVNSIPMGDKDNYKPIGWRWYNIMYSSTDSLRLEDVEVTHWAYIPEVDK